MLSYFWLVLIAFVVALAARRFQVPYALALVVTGMAIGIPRLLPHVHLEPKTLFTILLPPLLFESALNLRIEPLRRDWKPVTIYTFAGTLASTFIAGALMASLLHVPLVVGLVFGALISATDPISVLAIFKRLGAGPRLTLIIEAESLFNDTVAVVLFTIVLAALGGANASLAQGIARFCWLFGGGTLVGALVGALASRIHYEIDDHLVEITLTSVVAYGAYLCADAIHVSGVMAVIAAGMVIGNVGMQTTMSPGTRLAVAAFWEYAAFVVNSIVFLLIGIEVAYVDWRTHLWLSFAAVGCGLAGRAAIYPLSLLVNRFGGNVPTAWQHILFWGGLRGALSMALALALDKNIPQRDAIIAATFGVVLFSLLVQGMTLGPLLRKLGLAGTSEKGSADDNVYARRLAGEIMACEAALAQLESFKRSEAYPNWSVELLRLDYHARLENLQSRLATVRPDYARTRTQQAATARRQALLAEKSALQEAQRQDWLGEADWQRMTADIDAKLVAITRQEAH